MKFAPLQESFFGFEESEKLKRFFILACQVFEDYRFIYLPSLEVYSPELYGEGILLVGSLPNGELVCLRKDWTLSLARFLSLQKNLELPLKVFYFGSVFSSKGALESLQVGIEYIGEKSLQAEVEVISKLYSFLKAVGLSDLVVSLGHVRIAERLLQKHGQAYRDALINKNFYELEKVKELKELLFAYGGQEMLDEFTKRHKEFEKECEELRLVREGLKDVGVLFDLSELRPQSYYTGIVFEFFHPSVGQPIGGGGRYDGLYKNLGKDLCAVGGAVYLDRLLEL